MSFCPDCNSVLAVDVAAGAVELVCGDCNTRIPGRPADARIAGEKLMSGERSGGLFAEDLSMYEAAIRGAAEDRTTQRVARECRVCGLDSMAQVQIGETKIVAYTCTCGNCEFVGAGAAP